MLNQTSNIVDALLEQNQILLEIVRCLEQDIVLEERKIKIRFL